MAKARPLAAGLVLALAMAATTTSSHATEVAFGPHDVPTVFFISKSDDRNRVDYAIQLAARCAPLRDEAVFGYWREFEKAPPVVTHGFGMMDYVGYGIAEQRMLHRTPTGGEHLMRLKQLGRPILLATRKEADGKCTATARTVINGVESQLVSVHVKLAGALSVEYIDVHGKNLETGAAIDERIRK